MSVTHGMNIEEVRALGQDLQSRASNVDDIMGILERIVMNATWVGPNARRFKDQWWPEHRAKLRKVSEDLRGFGQSALNNASEQEQASGGPISAGAGVVSGTPLMSGSGGQPVGDGIIVGHPGATSGSLDGSDRSWEQVRDVYEANSPGMAGMNDHAFGAENQYQCTAWRNTVGASSVLMATSEQALDELEMAGRWPHSTTEAPIPRLRSEQWRHTEMVSQVPTGT